eukprot:2940762-Amphidinium_carterae.1
MPGLPAERNACKLSALPADVPTSRGTAAVWDLAILSKDGYALSPDQATRAELEAWSISFGNQGTPLSLPRPLRSPPG